MNNKEWIKKIRTMSPHELLEFVLTHPEYLTDGYYREFRDAIYARAKALNLY